VNVVVRPLALAAAGLVMVLSVACSTTPPAASPASSGSANLSPLANSDWQLTQIAGRPLPSGTPVTLLFSVLNAGGFSGCNQFTVDYATEDTGLRFGPVAGTRMSCGEALDTFESAYYAGLGAITHWKIANDVLTLTTGTGEERLVYGRMAPASVEGPWTVTAANNGQGAVSSVPAGVSASISFMPDGTVEGFGGCNNFNGGYSVNASKIAIGPLLAQLKACGEPADGFERQLLVALQTATKWSVTGGTLDLRDDNNAQQVSATTAIGH
jgi:heat shock protein HslJ